MACAYRKEHAINLYYHYKYSVFFLNKNFDLSTSSGKIFAVYVLISKLLILNLNIFCKDIFDVIGVFQKIMFLINIEVVLFWVFHDCLIYFSEWRLFLAVSTNLPYEKLLCLIPLVIKRNGQIMHVQ